MWKLLRPNNLSGRIILLLLLLEFSSITFWGGFVYSGSKQELESSIGKRLYAKAEYTSSLTEQFFHPILIQSELTAQTLSLLPSLKQHKQLLYLLLKSRPEIGAVSLVSTEGEILSFVSRSDYASNSKDDNRHKVATQSHTVFDALAGAVSFGPVAYSKYLEPEMEIAIPVASARMVMLVNVKLRWLWDKVDSENFGDSGYVYLLDQQKRLIAHPDPSLVRQKRVFELDPNSLLQNQSNQIYQYSNFSGTQVVGASRLTANNWWVVIEQPVEEALAPLDRIIDRFLLAMGFALVFTVWAVFYFSRLTTRPLAKLEQGVKRFALGERDVTVEVPDVCELASLAHSFNAMARRMDQYIVALRNEKERAEITLHSLGDAVVVTDASGVVEYLNPVAERLTGWDLSVGKGRPLDEVFVIVDASHRKPLVNPVSKVVAEGRVVGMANHTVLLSHTGQEYQIADSAAPIFSLNGELSGVVLVFRDVTQEYEMRMAVERSERNLHSISDSTTDAIIRIDERGEVIFWNPSAQSLFGYSAEEAKGKTLHGLISCPAKIKKALAHFSVSGELGCFSKVIEVEAINKSGDLVPVELSLGAIPTRLGWHAVGLMRDISALRKQRKDLKKAIKKIEFQAYHDVLTGLPNRRMLEKKIKKAITMATKHNTHGALLYVGLDNFSAINDSFGVSVGDELLRQAATCLRQLVEDADVVVARDGGNEFVLLFPPICPDETEIQQLAGKLANSLHQPINSSFVIDGHEYLMSASVGIAHYPEMGAKAEDLMRHANTALHKAKSEGRNLTRLFSPIMGTAADNYLMIETQLRYAVSRNQLLTYFQPQLNRAEEITGAEVLMRWIHPELGMVSPSTFIPIAEESGLIIPIGDWLLQNVSDQLDNWLKSSESSSLQAVSINISPNQFYQHDFVAQVEKTLGNRGAQKPIIILEITEGLLLRNIDETIEKMTYLKRLGYQFSIDDFGTGYSSLSYIQSLPIDELKIDQSFVKNMHTDKQQETIVETIMMMARKLQISVVAEGVENAMQLKLLKDLGCDIYQGFHLHKPLPADEFFSLMSKKINETND